MADGIRDLQTEVQSLKQEIVQLKSQQDKVSELVQWKSRIDDVVSPVQLKEMQQTIEDLKLFKTKAITIFLVFRHF